MRKDQIRLFSFVIAAGLLLNWWNVLEVLGLEHVRTNSSEIWLAKSHAIPSLDAMYIASDYRKMRVFLDTWKGLIILAGLTSIGLAWISRTWSLVVLSLTALIAYAGFLTFHGITFQISQVVGTNFVTLDYVASLKDSLDRQLAHEPFEAGFDSIVWFADAIFVRAPLFVGLVVFPLTALIELAHQWKMGRRPDISATA